MSIIPVICHNYLNRSRNNDDNYKKSCDNFSSNNDTKQISENCLCYNGKLLYLFKYKYFCGSSDWFYCSFEDFICDLFRYCSTDFNDDFNKHFYLFIDKLFKGEVIVVNGSEYHLIII